MRRKKTYLPHLFIALLFLGALLYVLINIDPSKLFKIGNVLVPSFIFFYLSLFLTLLFLGSFLLQSVRRGMLIGVGFLAILILRMAGFKDILYILIPLAIVILIEFLFWNRKDNN